MPAGTMNLIPEKWQNSVVDNGEVKPEDIPYHLDFDIGSVQNPDF